MAEKRLIVSTRLCILVVMISVVLGFILLGRFREFQVTHVAEILVATTLAMVASAWLQWRELNQRAAANSGSLSWPAMVFLLTSVAAQMSATGLAILLLKVVTAFPSPLLMAAYLSCNMVGVALLLVRYGEPLENLIGKVPCQMQKASCRCPHCGAELDLQER